MRSPAADESGWRARLAAAGVRVDLVGAEMLKAAADWLTWGLAQLAIEVMAAMRRESKPSS